MQVLVVHPLECKPRYAHSNWQRRERLQFCDLHWSEIPLQCYKPTGFQLFFSFLWKFATGEGFQLWIVHSETKGKNKAHLVGSIKHFLVLYQHDVFWNKRRAFNPNPEIESTTEGKLFSVGIWESACKRFSCRIRKHSEFFSMLQKQN